MLSFTCKPAFAYGEARTVTTLAAKDMQHKARLSFSYFVSKSEANKASFGITKQVQQASARRHSLRFSAFPHRILHYPHLILKDKQQYFSPRVTMLMYCRSNEDFVTMMVLDTSAYNTAGTNGTCIASPLQKTLAMRTHASPATSMPKTKWKMFLDM